jgi:hypothetical protein
MGNTIILCYDRAVVAISREHPVETERRLRRVIRVADVTHLAGAWCFRRFAGELPADALATIRDADGWCALVPAEGGGGERFAITLTTFSDAIENSGFVGWLATAIKQGVGSGVFVVCGDNPRRGGVFDYLGYPLAVAAEVRALIDDLRAGDGPDPLDLDLRRFEVVETSQTSAVSRATHFAFRERHGVVDASYAGGEIVGGRLIGRREGDRLRSAYAQLHADGQLRTGAGTMQLEREAGDRLRLVERYRWSDGAAGRNVLQSLGDG